MKKGIKLEKKEVTYICIKKVFSDNAETKKQTMQKLEEFINQTQKKQ